MVASSTRRAERPALTAALRAFLGILICAGLLSGPAQALADKSLADQWSPIRGVRISLSPEEMARAGATNESDRLGLPDGHQARFPTVIRRLVAVPDGASPTVSSLTVHTATGDIQIDPSKLHEIVWIEEVGRIRRQPVAALALDPAALGRADGETAAVGVEIQISFGDVAGPASVDAGPMSAVCARAIDNYERPSREIAPWRPPPPGESSSRNGFATYCHTVQDCQSAGVDVLFVVAEDLATEPVVFGYAIHQASYLGLNVGLVSMADVGDTSPEALKQFIQDVYDTQSAEHFGDGHLGFVMLVGDAYADDNQTVMIPVYNGYGGIESASDHYYACLSGDDDFEDVMVGRISVGNVDELTTALGKSVSYMPMDPGETWHERVLLVGGLFYNLKDEYVTLFDSYDELIPAELAVDRIYRHDYITDEECALDVVDAFNDGYLFVNFSGDGWISLWDHTMNTSHIDLMTNSQRLPIVLSMACSTGWLDNVTNQDQAGSYDCIAEQLVNAPNGGAVACLAAPRASDGGIFRSITKEIYRAAFEQHCVFTGELVATAKLLHLQAGGDVAYTRQFNLFGDPTLVFGWEFTPTIRPDLTAKEYQTTWTPVDLAVGDDLTVSVGVSNQSSVSATNVLVRINGISDAGSYALETTIPSIGPWATKQVEFVIATPEMGEHVVDIAVDPDDAILELWEDNNGFTHSVYVYPSVEGFPVDLGYEARGPCVVHLEGTSRRILVPDGDARLWSIDPTGAVDWSSDATWGASSYGPEVAAAAGDVDGDGSREIIATKFMGVVAFDPEGAELWTANTDDPVGHPVLADADSDGDLDVVVATRAYFGGPSSLIAIDENGDVIWSHALAEGVDVTTPPVAGYFDLDGRIDIAYGTSEGTVEAVSCDAIPPSVLWSSVDVGTEPVSALALADVEADGLLEIVVAGETVIYISAGDGVSTGWNVDLGDHVTSLATADIDGDGIPEVLAGSASGGVALIDDGALDWTRAVVGEPRSSASIADVDGDGLTEILVGTSEGYLYVLTQEGLDYVSPIPIPGSCATPFAADLTGDGALEVAACSSEGLVFAFSFGGPRDATPVPEWRGIGHGATRTAVLEQPFSGTLENSLVLSGDFQIVDDIVVAPGATMTVAAEAHLAFSGAGLKIQGSLNASGMPGGEILMTSSAPSRERWSGVEILSGATAAMTSCIITNADLGVEAKGAGVSLDDCQLIGNGEGARFENCSVTVDGTGFLLSDGIGLELIGGSGTVADCLVDGNGTVGLRAWNAHDYSLSRSTFSGTLDGHGAEFHASSNAHVDSCSFGYNSANGVLARTSGPRFTSCIFTANGMYGIEAVRMALPRLNWCTVVGNKIGVICGGNAFAILGDDIDPASGYNSIYGNQMAAVANFNTMPTPVYARRNWWGSAPPAGRIFMGYVVYSPWLTAVPNPSLHPSSIALSESEYGLSQNQPNPFNPSTKLTMTVAASGDPVLVAVYDASGRLVRTLHDGPAAAGPHELVWNGEDDRGNRVASGVYFARMIAPDFGAVRKMLLLK